jgi:transposase
MPPGPKAEPIVLTPVEQRELEVMSRRAKAEQSAALRARIILAAANGETNVAIANRLQVRRLTVVKWRARFLELRCEGLVDGRRSGAPRKISDEAVERAVRTTLEQRPVAATHWSTRSLAQVTGVSRSTVSRIWRAFGLQPHRVDTFKLSRDPAFTAKVRDIVGLYLDPPERAVVLCVDEKSQIQALDRTQPLLPMSMGHAEPNAAQSGGIQVHDDVSRGAARHRAALRKRERSSHP